MASVLCIPAFALIEAPTPMGVVIRISALKKGKDSPVAIENGEFYSFEDGWNRAMKLAGDRTNGYDRIVVDLLADWHANKDGEFGSGNGFNWSTICVPEKARVMLNMNGHTINRGLGDNNEYDGEVILIKDGADVIINGGKNGDPIANAKTGENVGNVQMGTIKGGNSDNGAGGIHMQDDSKLTLNNVNIVGNISDDDDGGGIAVYDGATLIMNGGSLSNNAIKCTSSQSLEGSSKGVGAYVEDSTAILTGVEIKNNQFYGYHSYGAAICARNSTVEIYDCIVEGNGIDDSTDEDREAANSIFFIWSTDFTAVNTDFINNGSELEGWLYDSIAIWLYPDDMNILIDGCNFENNNTEYIFDTDISESTDLFVLKTVFKNNKFSIYTGDYIGSACFESCVFENNKFGTEDHAFYIGRFDTLTFRDCDMGDSDFNDKSRVIFEDADGNQLPASIFGKGSLTMIVAFAALVASIAAIMINISSKKKTASAQKEQD